MTSVVKNKSLSFLIPCQLYTGSQKKKILLSEKDSMSLASNLTLMFMVLSLGILIMEKVNLWLKKKILRQLKQKLLYFLLEVKLLRILVFPVLEIKSRELHMIVGHAVTPHLNEEIESIPPNW